MLSLLFLPSSLCTLPLYLSVCVSALRLCCFHSPGFLSFACLSLSCLSIWLPLPSVSLAFDEVDYVATGGAFEGDSEGNLIFLFKGLAVFRTCRWSLIITEIHKHPSLFSRKISYPCSHINHKNQTFSLTWP